MFACALLLGAGAVSGAPSESAFAQQDIDPDDILMSITIADDGDAIWTIEYRTRLETDEEEQAFEELQSDVEADPEPYVAQFQDRMNTTASSAENATGREMEITDMTVSAEKRALPREYGVLTYQFRWSNFAAVDGDRLFVGDAIDGLFLDEETALLISWSEGYGLLDASPEPTQTRSESVVYTGPLNFASGEPRLELGPSDTTSPGDTDTGTDPTDGLSSSMVAIAALIALLFAGTVAAAFVVLRRRDEGGDAAEQAQGGHEHTETNADDANLSDAELLSNEEKVLRLIEREGGRMKQKAVAEELGWTDAKTSQVTKKLRENGDLDGFRLGRENVLSLPAGDSDSDSE